MWSALQGALTLVRERASVLASFPHCTLYDIVTPTRFPFLPSLNLFCAASFVKPILLSRILCCNVRIRLARLG
jgi:hypothetical protein